MGGQAGGKQRQARDGGEELQHLIKERRECGLLGMRADHICGGELDSGCRGARARDMARYVDKKAPFLTRWDMCAQCSI